jgi:hypothetical protein
LATAFCVGWGGTGFLALEVFFAVCGGFFGVEDERAARGEGEGFVTAGP